MPVENERVSKRELEGGCRIVIDVGLIAESGLLACVLVEEGWRVCRRAEEEGGACLSVWHCIVIAFSGDTHIGQVIQGR